MDTCGPFPVASPHGNLYFHFILDDFTNANAVVFLRDRSQVPRAVKTVLLRWETVMNAKIVTVRCDGAAEQAEGELMEWYRDRGIAVQVTAPYAHGQNGKSEKGIRTLEDDMHVLLSWSNLPLSFWEDAVRTASYTRFRLPPLRSRGS
ncbi:hypothetical protein MPER_00312 [Moniliophthora perniciosa FA553]|nr:hypothetical protein MPER_00312 [Moniliophthora perniciosa FA553]